METQAYWVRGGDPHEVVGETLVSAHTGPDARAGATGDAKHLTFLNPNDRFVVVDDSGLIVWSPEWQAD